MVTLAAIVCRTQKLVQRVWRGRRGQSMFDRPLRLALLSPFLSAASVRLAQGSLSMRLAPLLLGPTARTSRQERPCVLDAAQLISRVI